MDDVQARTDQQFTLAERARVAVLCADATAMARGLVPTMSTPSPPTAVGVVSTAVLRALATLPEGIKTSTDAPSTAYASQLVRSRSVMTIPRIPPGVGVSPADLETISVDHQFRDQQAYEGVQSGAAGSFL